MSNELRKQLLDLMEENERLSKELQDEKEARKQAEQRAVQAEAHMREMAANYSAPAEPKTYKSDRIRRSRRS